MRLLARSCLHFSCHHILPSDHLAVSAEQKSPARVATGRILDWSFTYGAEPGIYIATELAWWVCTFLQLSLATGVACHALNGHHMRILCVEMPLSMLSLQVQARHTSRRLC